MVKENSFRVKEWKGEKHLVVESVKMGECLSFIKSSKFIEFKGLIISKDLGYSDNDLNFLADVPPIESIAVSDYISDISGIYFLPGLKVLKLAENRQKIDLSKFPKLEEVSFDWSPKIEGINSCKNLKKLIIGKFNPKSNSINEIPELDNLTEITIVKSTITELNGINKFKKLKKLDLAYLNRLESLVGLDSNSLENLEFTQCRKIKNHDYVKRLVSLKVLKFNDCGEMQSIGFIKEMPNLVMFTFVNTNVVDGDMTPCVKLEYVGFSDKKHYSHTFKEIERIINKNKAVNSNA